MLSIFGIRGLRQSQHTRRGMILGVLIYLAGLDPMGGVVRLGFAVSDDAAYGRCLASIGPNDEWQCE